MLESLTLRNWQTHEELAIQFDSRVTVIIGDTDAGKSSILRALRWVTLNQFDGPADSFINWDAAFAKVTLVVDGQKIVRKKGQHNSYSFNGQEYRAFGLNKVPETISDFLKLSEVNFQAQFDSHFWLSETAGQVSRELNQIVNLNVIDEALSHVSGLERQTKSKVEVCRERLKSARDELNQLEFVSDANAQLKALEQQSERNSTRQSRRLQLSGSIAALNRAREDAIRTAAASEAMSDTLSASKRLLDASQSVGRLKKLIGEMVSARSAANRVIPELPNPENLTALTERRRRLASLIHSISDTIQRSEECQHELQQTQTELQKATKGKCPVCGNKM